MSNPMNFNLIWGTPEDSTIYLVDQRTLYQLKLFVP